ncbi:DUF4271 domain-containing protein [Asinibacterium sp. OR53]|uniref:DUF4271 domain-containing protein n=1 Tax=Asinibacterium sp. OR53 TaxID=925409 RepID=UPI0012F9ACA3|nr:DUF4271 domain-containing protein [Asinibacterium sp. OR53]
MKQTLLIVLLVLTLGCFAQTDSGLPKTRPESTLQKSNDTQSLTPKETVLPVRSVVNDSSSSRLPKPTVAVNQASAPADSLRQDSIRKAKAAAEFALPVIDTSTYARFMHHPYLPENKPAAYMLIDYRKRESKDQLFYVMAGLVFFFAFLKVVYPRYFKNLFNSFFQTSVRLKQTKEQLLQDNLASLLTNLLFVISVSLYAALVIRYEQWALVSFWQLVIYGAMVLMVVYLGKYLFLLFSGWVFNSRESAAGYVFIVFLVNKTIGIVLIPFALLVAFAAKPLSDVALTVSGGVIVLLFLYRYIVSFTAIRNNLKVNALHFFLYLCAVEVLPLLLIYKVLINYIDGRF